MKKFAFIFFAMLLFSMFAYGQKESANFGGTWTLDVEKSELGERSRIESMTMSIVQTEKELSYERKAVRAENTEGGGGRRGMGRGGRGGGNPSATFDLTGKETSAPTGGPGGSAKLKAEMDGSNMKLTQTREFEGRNGAISIITIETWSLSEDGKTLTISSNTETPRGPRNSTMVFTKAE